MNFKKKVFFMLAAILALSVFLSFGVFAAEGEGEATVFGFWSLFNDGTVLSLIGAFLAVTLSGIGSAKGVGIAGQTATGVVAEYPELSGKFVSLEALPATQGIYGFIVAFLVMIKNGVIGGSAPSVTDGMYYLFACLPIAVVGLISAIHQGKVAASGMQMVAKQKKKFGMAIVYSAVVETYAILALLISVLLIMFR